MKEKLKDAYEDLKVLTPDLVKEEIVFQGVFITVARVTVDCPHIEDTDTKAYKIVAEGTSKRSGDKYPDKPNGLGREIALGRARKAMALKLASKRSWRKIHNNMMA